MKIFPLLFLLSWMALSFPALGLPSSFSGPSALDQSPLSISTGKKGLVVVFLSAACPCSNSHLEELRDLEKKYTDFHFVGIHSNRDEERDFSQAYFKKAALPFPVLQDHQAKWADELKAFKTPHAYVILPDGKVAYQGGVSDSHELKEAHRKYLREALDDLTQDRPVKTPRARAVGCVISREGSGD
jgi:hypothetical protein